MIRRPLLGAGVLAVVAAVVLAFLPLHQAGVSGNAVRPTYISFGWFSYAPMPEHATVAQLRAAGVHVPSYVDGSRRAVTQRRWTAGVLGGVGVVLIAVGLLVRRRRPNAGSPA